MEEHALWREGVVEKFGSMEGGWRTKTNTVPFGCSMWRSIMKGGKTSAVTLHLRLGTAEELAFGTTSDAGRIP